MQKDRKQRGGESRPRSQGLSTRLRRVAFVQEAVYRELSKVLGQACCDSQHQDRYNEREKRDWVMAVPERMREAGMWRERTAGEAEQRSAPEPGSKGKSQVCLCTFMAIYFHSKQWQPLNV